MSSDGDWEGRRIADDAIYLSEDRREEPKQIFLQMAELLGATALIAGTRCLDVGCATGDLLHFLRQKYPDCELSGLDVSSAMIEEAQRRLPEARFVCGNVKDARWFSEGQFDVIAMSGVLNCIDEPKPIVDNLIHWARPGGRVIILDMVNRFPIDVLVRHRRVEQDGRSGEWERGWNYFSETTLRALLKNNQKVRDFRILPFAMSFPLSQRADPMRTWTFSTAEAQHQLVNGARQLVDLSFVDVRIRG